jgi:hypothetical protein
MENAVAVYETPALTALQLREQVNLIQEVMKSVMRENEHYGKIPGCGDKPSLLKPGAEKLMFTFRLVADPEVEVFELYHPTVQGHREYRVKVRISSINGTYMGGGVGSCSTMESKYRFRGGEKISTDQKVPTEYWNLKKAGKFDEAKALIGGDNYGVAKIDGAWMICEIGEKQEHDNPADFYNTCEKIAKKRALVDATLTVTAASDIFTQDIEELVDNGVMTPKAEPKKEPVQQPQKKTEIKNPDEPATEMQIKAINAMLTKLGVKDTYDKHYKVSRIIELPEEAVIDSFNNLTKGQASKVIETLTAEGTK